MAETVIFPSPNWFQVSVLAVSKDGWLVYGGPSKSLVVLEPLKTENKGVILEDQRYQAHVVNRAHPEKIVSVDISPEWPEKKALLTGSVDGSVKQWSIDQVNKTVRLKSTHSHNIDQHEKEEVSGVAYSGAAYAITVGCFGSITKWDLSSNVVKIYNTFLKSFKPTCMACSPHVPLNVAVGTKQGVVFVLDLSGPGKIVYKVRGQDDEIINVSWCPQYDVLLKKSLKESERKSHAMERLEKIRSEGKDESLDKSAITKDLPEDSFDDSVVQEDDMFDIYKDHEADEFGHKKFVPEDIIVKVKQEKKDEDFLAECLKLKEEILRKKNEPEPSIATLVDALDKTHVDSDKSDESVSQSEDMKKEAGKSSKVVEECSAHTHKHLLASIGKFGGVRLWSKSGKLVGTCAVPYSVNKNQRNKGPNSTTLLWYTPDVLLIADGKSQMLECNPLKIDCKNKLEWKLVHALHRRGLYCIATNAPRVQSSDQTYDLSRDEWTVWTVAQDRNLVCFSIEKRKKVAMHNTCGGFLYNIQPCPYDAKKVAVGVGDGAVRVWEADTEEDDTKLSTGKVSSFWQNVQGKVLTVAWHPTKENCLAFATAEARVGLIDTSGKSERPARTLVPALRGGVYSLCWGDAHRLYACGGGELVVYRADAPDEDPSSIKVSLEGKQWELSVGVWSARGLAVGSAAGAVAVLEPHSHELLAASFVFNKMIHCIEWHPLQTSSSSEESTYKNLIAISSLDKQNNVVIVEFADKGDGPKLHTWKTLSGHKGSVLQVAWNPHKDAQVLSTSHDCTVRIWDAAEGVCISIFGGHVQTTLGAAWSMYPQLATTVLSGGGDCCLRLWTMEEHPPEAYREIKHEIAPKKEKKKNKEKKTEQSEMENEKEKEKERPSEVNVATNLDCKAKISRKFLLPATHRHMWNNSLQAVKKLAQKYLKSDDKTNGDITPEGNGELKAENTETNGESEAEDIKVNGESKLEVDAESHEPKEDENPICFDFTKIFGNTNDVNEILDKEMHEHLEKERFGAWIMLSIFRGHIDAMIQFASQRDLLCPFLVSLSPCVSFKYWKDVTQLYLAQMDRLIAKGEENTLFETNLSYGGAIYRKVALLLSVHDVKGAVATLNDAYLYKEAYILSKARHMDSIAEDTLKKWAKGSAKSGNNTMAAICSLILDDPYQAAVNLAKTNQQEYLSLAADLAKAAGQSTFATHIEDKKSQILSETPVPDSIEDLKPLPTKVDLLKENICIGDETEVIEAKDT